MNVNTLAQQRGKSSIFRPEATYLKATRRRYVVAWAAKPAMYFDTTRPPQNSEVSIVVPMEQPLAPVPATQGAFGVGKAGGLAAAVIVAGVFLNRIKKR